MNTCTRLLLTLATAAILPVLASDDDLSAFEKFRLSREYSVEAESQMAEGDYKDAAQNYRTTAEPPTSWPTRPAPPSGSTRSCSKSMPSSYPMSTPSDSSASSRRISSSAGGHSWDCAMSRRPSRSMS